MKNYYTSIASLALIFIFTMGLSQGKLTYPIVNTDELLSYDAQTEVAATTVQIFNTVGALIYSENLSGVVSESIDISSFSEGVYFLSVSSATSKNVKKFIKN